MHSWFAGEPQAAQVNPLAEPQAAMLRQFYMDWVDTIASKEDSYSKKLMV